ncbi:c-type cytochrome biogenesis protein CcmI [Methylomarinum vadi]|uniref:c-type cytochrome biogenesis protein CcmI n=1 Tax=Methylomarinum vadi TaxID=438855 RepID=UPI0004DECEEF|nr:c-type cytochrome biogenesis protein CcmI [Methylomarinum vadi]
MNSVFWLAVALLIATALMIIVVPLWRRSDLAESDVEQRNIKIARERLQELKQQLRDGALSQQQFDEQYQELELSLSDDLDSILAQSRKAGQGKWMIVAILLFVPLVSLSLYFTLGDTQAMVKVEQQQLALQKQQEAQQTIFKMVNGLAERLQQQPNDSEGWLMLGRSLKYMRQYDKAAQAFAQAYRLLGEEPSVMLQYADALAMAQGGKLSGKPAELIFKALSLAPDDATGLWLGGMAKAEMGEYQQALRYWQKLEPKLAGNPESLREVQGLIAALKERIAETGGLETASGQTGIEVEVKLDDSLYDKVQAGDTVFIYAQALNGPKMPLAIVRKRVADLPLSVELNDALAMTPAMKLSAFDNVKVIARISKSGNAMPQPGDLIGYVDTAEPGQDRAVVITINQQVK